MIKFIILLLCGVLGCAQTTSKTIHEQLRVVKDMASTSPDLDECGDTWQNRYLEANCGSCEECCVDMDVELEKERQAQFLCSVAVTRLFPRDKYSYSKKVARKLPEKFDVCLDLVEAATVMGEDPVFIIAIAIVESRLSLGAVSSAGAVGPLQILPKYHCPDKTVESCDLIFDGVRAVMKYKEKYGGPDMQDESSVLCHYNAGNVCGERSKSYAKRVLAHKFVINVALKFWEEL